MKVNVGKGEAELLEEPPQLEGKLAVFPNPSHTWADVQYELPKEHPTGTLLITAVNGRVVQQINLSQTNGLVELDTQDWIPGVYFIALVTDNTLQYQTTLIVRR